MEQKLSRRGTRLYFKSSVPGQPTVVLIHNMWENHRLLSRHVQLFHSLGYNCVSFNLYGASTISDPHPFGWWGRWGFLHQRWEEQIRDVLESIEGPKVVFSLSGPSISALLAASQRTDVTHWICDSGPFKEIWECTFRLLTLIWPIPNKYLRWMLTAGFVLSWGPHAFYRSQKALKRWAHSVPILSIRGLQDPLIHDSNIDGIFKNHPHLDLTIWKIPEAQHLDGLKRFPEAYKKAVLRFLKPTEIRDL